MYRGRLSYQVIGWKLCAECLRTIDKRRICRYLIGNTSSTAWGAEEGLTADNMKRLEGMGGYYRDPQKLQEFSDWTAGTSPGLVHALIGDRGEYPWKPFQALLSPPVLLF